MEAAALAFMAGCGPEFLAASSAADLALYRGIIERVVELRVEEDKRLARLIRQEIGQMLGG